MPIYILIEYDDNYSKTSGSSVNIIMMSQIKAGSESFKHKIKITGNTSADSNTKDVKIIGPLKYLRTFWRTLEVLLINCEAKVILKWSSTCFITNSTGAGRFTISDTNIKIIQNCFSN